MKKYLRIISAALAVVLLVTCMPFGRVSALTDEEKARRDELRTQRTELQSQLKNLNKQISSYKDEIKKEEARAATYAQRKEIVASQIEAIKESIALKEEELAQRQKDLEQKIKDIEETYELFKERMRALYMSNGDSSTLELLLGSSSFTDFVMNSESNRRVSQHDTDLIDRLETEQKEIESEKAAIAETIDNLESDKTELDAKYDEYAALQQEANNAVTTAQAMKAATEDDYDEILAIFEATQEEWNKLTAVGSGYAEYIGMGDFIWPVPNYYYISSGFGWRTLYGKPNNHHGIDIAGGGINWKPIVAADSGYVKVAAYNYGGYGNYVILDHGGDIYTVYGHMNQYVVYTGQWVDQGTTIGYVGSTGNSTGPHLHFEIRMNGDYVNPMNYFTQG